MIHGPKTTSHPAVLDALNTLFRGDPVRSDVFRHARRILKCDDLAGDAVQEAVIALWRLESPPPAPRQWLMRTVTFRCLHALRALHRRQSHERLGRVRESCPLDHPPGALMNGELRDCLQNAVDSLQPEFRTVFLLREEEGLDYHEIAVQLSIPVGTVRSRLARARAHLRARLESIPGCPG